VSPHSCRHYFGSEPDLARCFRGGESRWLGHSSPGITWRVYSYLMASDEDAGRAAMGRTMSAQLADVYPDVYP
jgi:integrase